MKTFEVELKRESYVTLTIDANNREEAEEKAWHQIEQNYPNINDSQWNLSSIEEK
jgi:hypothetical protein